jgi:two-component system, NarL family, response regulator NreC
LNTSILLVDDHALFREGLQLLLETQTDFHVIGQAANGSEALTAAESLKPDIIILDMLMPGMSGLDTLSHLRQSQPACRVIMLSMSDEEIYVHTALQGGASAYILKDTSTEDLALGVRAVIAGKIYLSPRLVERAIRSYLQNPLSVKSGVQTLTRRESEVLQHLAQGLGGPEVARRLCISLRTVESHRSNIMHKLGLHSQLELIDYARQNHIITPTDSYLSRIS